MALHESAEDYLEALYLLQKSYQRYVQSILQIFSDTVNQVLRIKEVHMYYSFTVPIPKHREKLPG